MIIGLGAVGRRCAVGQESIDENAVVLVRVDQPRLRKNINQTTAAGTARQAHTRFGFVDSIRDFRKFVQPSARIVIECVMLKTISGL
jgi:hypothetical protein